MSKLAEKTINIALGNALRKRRRVWENGNVLQVEPLQALQSKGQQPDILITEPGRDPVVIETEALPAPTVEQDARARLGVKTTAGDPIRTAIAVRFPSQWREAQNEHALNEAIENDPLEWVIWSSDGTNLQRWPKKGWMRSSISQLAFAAYQSTLASHRVKKASEALASAVLAAGEKINQMAGAGYNAVLEKIAQVLFQTPSQQTWGMAALILANALAFHELLARRGNLAHVPTPSELRAQHGDNLRRQDVLPAWAEILAVNYLPIFAIARDILVLIPDPFANPILTELDSAITDAGLRTLLPSHDILSETFQRLIVDRKSLASFYTLPETAALLAALALTPDQGFNGRAWHDAEGLKSVVIADYACGTGTLLAAAYRRMAWLHESSGGNPAALHAEWMSNSLLGIDVLPAAVHLTATILSSLHPTVHYTGSQIYIAPYGPSSSGPHVSIGSLDLLDSQLDVTDFFNLATQVGAHASIPIELRKRAKQADLCIMNPPYTRNTNHEGERANDALPAFAAFGLSSKVQKAMGDRLKTLGKGTFAHGNAGIASHFLALADQMTKDGGTLAMVLPLAFLTGSSWEQARKELTKHYSDLIVVTITGLYNKDFSFSADTGMAECLLVARKRRSENPARIIMVSLDQRPTTTLVSTLLAERITDLTQTTHIPRLEDPPHGGVDIWFGEERAASVLSIPAHWGPGWVGARIADFSLAQAAYHLANGRAWLPGILSLDDTVEVPMTTFASIAYLGPLHRDINGAEKNKQGHPRGPFDVVPLVPGEVPTYPILWKHDAKRETTLEFEPDCKGVPRSNADPEKLAEVVASATHLHINLDWQFNSQPLQAQWTDRPAIGGTAWPSVLVHPHDKSVPCDPTRERLQALALLLWLNSTPGILLRWLWSNRQQKGRGRITREVVPSMPVLDVRALSSDQLSQSETLFLSLRHKKLLPVHQLANDPVREELDRLFLGDILGWPQEWFDTHAPLDLVRRKLSAEPSVHGHKQG